MGSVNSLLLKGDHDEKILLTLMLVGLASGVQSDEVFQGSQAAEIMIGNTLEANYRPVGECGKKVFYEYYDQSGKTYGLEKRLNRPVVTHITSVHGALKAVSYVPLFIAV